MQVLIVGGGVGGLCLAQGLRKRGIEVAVLERDETAESRSQGFRLRIDSQGRGALASCLPGTLYDLCLSTANDLYMSRGVTLDENLKETSSVNPEGEVLDPALASTVVNRRTLRQILLTGIEDQVHFGREVTHYETLDDQVVVHCSDGSMWMADVLVAADGINSVVRGQLLPDVTVIDTDLRAIYGQLYLDDETLSWVPDALFGGSRPVMGPQRRTLALGAFRPAMPIAQAVAEFAPHANIEPVRDYLKWTLVAPIDSFPVDETTLFTATPERLHSIASEMTAGWSEIVRRIIDKSVVEITFPLAIKASVPDCVWEPSRVTVLGDAIHATTPVGGTGANTALRDAALLAQQLAEAPATDNGVTMAIGQYEAEMRRYGYEAVNNSLWGAERIFRSRPLASRGDVRGA